MLVAATTAVAEIVFCDAGGSERQFRLHFPFASDYDAIYSSASSIASAAQALSNGKLCEITVRWIMEDTDPLEPALLSNVARYLCLYYSNDVDTEPVFIPSGNPALLETEGDFAGIRLDLANPSVVLLADALTTALLESVGFDLEPWGRVLVVGGITA